MIVAPQPLAVEGGAKELAAGNAFDAALACAAVQFVIFPHSCGLGGFDHDCWPADGRGSQAIVDAPALAGPSANAANYRAPPAPTAWRC